MYHYPCLFIPVGVAIACNMITFIPNINSAIRYFYKAGGLSTAPEKPEPIMRYFLLMIPS
jgi:hypothetical protein